VATTAFFTPVLDDPYHYGAIAAANALSDVYAMGGKPFLALNIAALPPDLPHEISAEILRGGAEKTREAGVALAGGHTVQDKEPKYGLVVLGFANPQALMSKSGARPGDTLVLSKPLGFGTVATALKREQVDPSDLTEAAGWMKRLNRLASELAVEFGLRGGTDITGFGLLGHGMEMDEASGVRLRFHFERIAFTRGALGYAARFIFPGGSVDNKLFFGERVSFVGDLDDGEQMLLFDAQTSGGLLFAVPPEKLADLLARAAQVGQPLWEVGEVIPGAGIEVTR